MEVKVFGKSVFRASFDSLTCRLIVPRVWGMKRMLACIE